MWCATVKTDLAERGSFWLVVHCCETRSDFSDVARRNERVEPRSPLRVQSVSRVRGMPHFHPVHTVPIGAILSCFGFCIGDRQRPSPNGWRASGRRASMACATARQSPTHCRTKSRRRNLDSGRDQADDRQPTALPCAWLRIHLQRMNRIIKKTLLLRNSSSTPTTSLDASRHSPALPLRVHRQSLDFTTRKIQN
jgi:hypothetical protein